MPVLLVVKTIDGSHIVGQVEADDSVQSFIAIHNPLEIIYHSDEMTGATGASLQRYNSFGSTDTIAIMKAAIVTMYPANDLMNKTYEDVLARLKNEKSGKIDLDKREALKESITSMLEKLSSNGTVH